MLLSYYGIIKSKNEYLGEGSTYSIYDPYIKEKFEYLEKVCVCEQVKMKQDKQNFNTHYFSLWN